jgi:tRNA threonylcarbamoyladenosine biosynthesis protein TsaB
MRDAILALELSTVSGSVAVAAGGRVLFEAEFEARRSHNAQVFGPLGEALAVAGERLGGIVVGTGPGSYTGVRIAIAAAEAVGMSKGVPVTGMSSFLGCVEEETFGVVGDARRGRWYVAEVREGVLVTEIALIKPEEARARMEATGLSRWLTCDMEGPMAGLERVKPRAGRLALRAEAAGRRPPQQGMLEPIYLEGAFITQPRKR